MRKENDRWTRPSREYRVDDDDDDATALLLVFFNGFSAQHPSKDTRTGGIQDGGWCAEE